MFQLSVLCAQDIKVTGGFDKSLSKQDLFTMGGNYSNIVTGNNSDVKIKVHKQNQPKTFGWKVEAYRVDLNWHNDLKVFIRMTSTGNGPGSIYSGFNFTELSNFPTEICNGNGQLNNIKFQFEIRGVSVLIPADTYRTKIIYTLVAN
ncbi:MAG: hypothetical protein N4A46_00185 [Schleiferiaceae bacterium]|jgi:hypothetical protein|nr:hypothetical protein [Schleiferiaceae bacterium]